MNKAYTRSEKFNRIADALEQSKFVADMDRSLIENFSVQLINFRCGGVHTSVWYNDYSDEYMVGVDFQGPGRNVEFSGDFRWDANNIIRAAVDLRLTAELNAK